MDGLKVCHEETQHFYVQQFYSGWTHDNYVTKMFVFSPDGDIPVSKVNVPGCVHNSLVVDWGCIFHKLNVF